MPEDFASDSVAVDAPDFSESSVAIEEPTKDFDYLPPLPPYGTKGQQLREELGAAREELNPVTEFFAGPNPIAMPGASESAALASPIGYRIQSYTIPKGEPAAVQTIREAGRGVAELAHGMTEPEMLPLAPLAAIPVARVAAPLRHVIPKAMGILFGGQAAGAGAGEIVAGIEQEDPRLIGRGIPQVGMGVGMAGPAIKFPRSIQALRQEPRVVAPENLPVTPTAAPRMGEARLPRGQQVVGQDPMAGEYRVLEDSNRAEIESGEAKATAEIAAAWESMTLAERDNALHGRGIPQRFGGRAPDIAETGVPPVPAPSVAAKTPAPMIPVVVPSHTPTVHGATSEQKQPEPAGEQNAIQVTETGELLPNVRPSTGEVTKEVPAATGAEGVRAGTETQTQPEVPLKPAEAPLTPAEQSLAQAQLQAEEPGISTVEKPETTKAEVRKVTMPDGRVLTVKGTEYPIYWQEEGNPATPQLTLASPSFTKEILSAESKSPSPAQPTAVPATKPAPEPTATDVTTAGVGEALPPIQRKSPTVGTPEREAIESAFDAADAKRTEAYEKVLKAKEEREKMGRFTQARDRKDKQVERLEEAYQKVKTATEDVIQRGIQAHREDRAGAVNPLAAIDAREQLKLISSNDAYNLKMRLLMEEGRRQGLSPEEAKTVANEAITFTAFKPEETLSSIVEYRTGRTRFETVKREAQREMDTVLEESRGTYPRSSVPEERVRRAMENAHDKAGVDKALAEAKELAKSRDVETKRVAKAKEQAEKDRQQREMDLARKLQSEGKLFWIWTAQKRWVPVDAKPVKIEGFPWLKAFIRKAEGEWVVSEETSGSSIGSAPTRVEAIKSANERVAKAGEQRLRELIDSASKTLPGKPSLEAPPETPIRPGPATGEGPGAAPKGFGPYPAVQQLTDQLRASPPVGAKQRLSWGDRIADIWSSGKDILTRAVGRAKNSTETIKDIARGVRSVDDLQRRLGEFDFAIQESSARSRNVGRAMEKQMPDVTDREAAAILIDSARIATDPNNPAAVRQVIQDSIALLPADTPKNIRLAYERALDPSLDIRQFTESLKQYYGIREIDAKDADLFEDGLKDYYTHIWEKESNMPDSLRGAMTSGKVSTYFQFGRQRKLPTFIEGIIEGKKPVLDPAKVVPFYNYSMDRAIASRELVKAFSELKASDGRPAVEPAGVGSVVSKGVDDTVLIKPKVGNADIADYKFIDHPAMRKWKWATTTPEGSQVLLQGELKVHLEFYERLARIMDRQRLTPGKTMRTALDIGSEVKALKFGTFPSLFHQIHIGSHAAFHWTDPFFLRKRGWIEQNTGQINWDHPFVRQAIEQGHLKIAPNPSELNAFAEGIGTSKFVQKVMNLIPGLPVGEWSHAYTNWLFTEYIPKLKLATYENALARAQFAQSKMKLFKGVTPEELASRTGDSVNNAYGELNQLFLGKNGRDPRLQRALRLSFLAPDFGEARLRFAEKAFTKLGHEERLAMATMAFTLYTTARIANFLGHGDPEWDFKNAFRVKAGQHWWSMRSVVGDVVHALTKFPQFLYVRLNPATTQRLWDLLAARDVNTGRKLTWQDQLERAVEAPLPIQSSGLTREDQKAWEGLSSSMGVSAQRDTPEMDIRKLAANWRAKNNLASDAEFIPGDGPSYQKLRNALRIGADRRASSLLKELQKTHSDKAIERAMSMYLDHPFTGSREHEDQFVATLTKPQVDLYIQARAEQRRVLNAFYALYGNLK